MIEYLSKVIICSFLFLGFYFLFLQREKMFTFNRVYLFLTVLLSLSIPLFIITLPNYNDFETKKNTVIIPLKKNNVYSKGKSNIEKSTKSEQSILVSEKYTYKTAQWYMYLKWETIILYAYGIMTMFFIIRFLLNLLSIYRKIIKSKKVYYDGVFLIINHNKEQLYSFWNYIFIPKQGLKESFSRKELLEHEMAHIKQKHSIDIVVIELIKSIFWFNPIFYLYKKAIQLNHEFLADEAVLKTKTDVYEYQKLILNTIQARQTVPITSNFNYILTKKRLLMMNKKGNLTKALFLQFFSIPFILILVYTFSTKVYAKENVSNELTLEQKEQLKQALEIDDLSNYLKDTLVSSSVLYVDTIMIREKVFVISSSKKNLKKIFEVDGNQKLSEFPKEKFSVILKNITPVDIDKTFVIRELKDYDLSKKKIETTNKDDASYKVSSNTENNVIETYHNLSKLKITEENIQKKEVDVLVKKRKIKIDDEEIQVNIDKVSPKDISQSTNEIVKKNDMDEFSEEMKKFREEMRGLGQKIKKISQN